MGRSTTGDHDDLARAPIDHLRQHRLAGVDYSHQVDFHSFRPLARFGADQRSDGALNSGGRNQNVHRTHLDPHPVNGSADLLEIPHVGAEPERGAAGMLDLELSQVQLRLTARQKSYARSGGGKAQGQALADASAASGDEH